MYKVKKAILLSLTAMLVASCSNAPVNTLTPGSITKSQNVTKTSNQALPPRIKITTNKSELAKYVTKISNFQQPGFKTKAYSLTNLEFDPTVAVNDPTDLDAHATHVEVLDISNQPGIATADVMGQIAYASGAVDVQLANVKFATDLLNIARINLKNNRDSKAVPTLQQRVYDAESTLKDTTALYDSIRFNQDKTEFNIYNMDKSQKQFFSYLGTSLIYNKMQLKDSIAKDRGNQSPYLNGTMYTAATFNAHYVEDGQIYNETENGYKQGYVLLIDNSDELNPAVVAKIGMSGAEFTMAYASGNNLYITGNDPAAPKNGAIQNQAFVMEYDVSDPENPIYRGIVYLKGRTAVSIHSGNSLKKVFKTLLSAETLYKPWGQSNMIVATGQNGKLYEIDPDLSILSESDSSMDLRDAIWNGKSYMAIDGGYKDGIEIDQTIPTTGTASGSPSFISNTSALGTFSTINNLAFQPGSDNLGQLGSNLAKASIAQIGNANSRVFEAPAQVIVQEKAIATDMISLQPQPVLVEWGGFNKNKYALGLSEGGIKIVDDSGAVLASAPIPGRTVNHVYVSPNTDSNRNYTIVASAGYNGIEFFSFNPLNDSLQNIGSQALYERVNGGNTRVFGASTNGFNFQQYSYIGKSGKAYKVNLGMVANGVNGATYGLLNPKQVTASAGVGYFSR